MTPKWPRPESQIHIHVDKKICTGCNLEKPIDEFRKSPRSIDGRVTQCNDCLRKAGEKQRERRRDGVIKVF